MYKIRFKTVEYVYEALPKCNLCDSEIELTNHLEKCQKDKPFYKIVKCSNDSCSSNTSKLRKNDLYRAYLPSDVAEDKINSVKDSLKKTNRYCVEYWLEKGLNETEAKEKISELQLENNKKIKPENRVKITKEFYRNKGLSEEEIRLKTLVPSQLDFWIAKGYDEDEAKIKLKENQDYAHSKIDQSSILRTNQKEYWIDKGYSEEESRKKVSERQTTFSKEICIEKYGETEGIKIWSDRQDKWNKSLNENGNMKIGYSKISQDLFESIKEYYSNTTNIFYAIEKGEKKIKRENGSYFLYDFVDEKSKKIIEFNGDMYHANPKMYEANDYPHPFRKELTASEIWEKDKEKKVLAEKYGYVVLYIWDSDVRRVSKERYQEILNKCLEFLGL